MIKIYSLDYRILSNSEKFYTIYLLFAIFVAGIFMRTVLYILMSAVFCGTGREFCAAASLVYDSTYDTFLIQNAGNSLIYCMFVTRIIIASLRLKSNHVTATRLD